MADKNDLLVQIATLFADNASGDISPSDLRTALSAMVSADLNLDELTTQEILGQIDFDVSPTVAGASILTPVAYCDYVVEPNLTLTTTEQLVTGWSAETTAFGISESNGVFTALLDGVYNISIERTYENDDTNPALVVNVTMTVYATDGQGGTPVIVLQRTVPLSSATASNEPSILSITTPANRPVPAGTEFTVYVNGEDSGGNPQDTRLILAKVTATLTSNLPLGL